MATELGTFISLPRDILRLLYKLVPTEFSSLNHFYRDQTTTALYRLRSRPISIDDVVWMLRSLVELLSLPLPQLHKALVTSSLQEVDAMTKSRMGVHRPRHLIFITLSILQPLLQPSLTIRVARTAEDVQLWLDCPDTLRVPGGPPVYPDLLRASSHCLVEQLSSLEGEPVLPDHLAQYILCNRYKNTIFAAQRRAEITRRHLDYLLSDIIDIQVLIGYPLLPGTLTLDSRELSEDEISLAREHLLLFGSLELRHNGILVVEHTAYNSKDIDKFQHIISILWSVQDYLELHLRYAPVDHYKHSITLEEISHAPYVLQGVLSIIRDQLFELLSRVAMDTHSPLPPKHC